MALYRPQISESHAVGLGAPTTAARRDLLPTVCRQLDILSKVSAPLFFCFWDLGVERGSKDAGDPPPNNESALAGRGKNTAKTCGLESV